jgi:hypothetical protein
MGALRLCVAATERMEGLVQPKRKLMKVLPAHAQLVTPEEAKDIHQGALSAAD